LYLLVDICDFVQRHIDSLLNNYPIPVEPNYFNFTPYRAVATPSGPVVLTLSTSFPP
jgi:hypothetical protein